MTLEPAPLLGTEGPEGGRAFWLRATDGVRLRAAYWPGSRGTVLVLPGRTEYIEKYALVITDLAQAGWGALVIDWRGQGLSDRLSGDAALGHVARFSDYQLDLAALRRAAEALSAPAPMPVLAHSMGGCIALRALVDGLQAPAAAFSAPMWGLPLDRLMRLGIRTMALMTRPLGRDTAYLPTTGPVYGLPSMVFDDNPLTRDRAQFERMQGQIRAHSELVLGGPSLRWGGAALAEMAALARLPTPDLPALIGLGGNERIVCPAAIRAQAARWSQAELVDYPGAEHELMMEVPITRDDFLSRTLALLDRA
ncbi:MAG: alpha/beta hydrolase [Pararhodobacter sp.]|nr:alpha/beta hydrolase [Pararhodobacter sp.]